MRVEKKSRIIDIIISVLIMFISLSFLFFKAFAMSKVLLSILPRISAFKTLSIACLYSELIKGD